MDEGVHQLDVMAHIVTEDGEFLCSLLDEKGIALKKMDGFPLGIVHAPQVDFAGQVFVFQTDTFIHDEEAHRRNDAHKDSVRIPEELVHVDILGHLDEYDGQRKKSHVIAIGLIPHEQGGWTHPAEHVQAAWQEQQIAERVNHGNGKKLVLGRIDMKYIINENSGGGVYGTDPEPGHAENIQLLGDTGMEPEKTGCHVNENSKGKCNLQVGHPGGWIFEKFHINKKHDGRQDQIGEKHTPFLFPAEYIVKRNIANQCSYEMGDCHCDRHQNVKFHLQAPEIEKRITGCPGPLLGDQESTD